MLIENGFTVLAAPDRVWSVLFDVERVAACVPGAELTETVDERTWKGVVHLRVGPVALDFAGTVQVEERDDDARRVVLRAKGLEQRGKGSATATMTARLEPEGEGTAVRLETNLQLTGTVAQVSRGLLPDVAASLTERFAECLCTSMLEPAPAAEAPGVPPANGPAERGTAEPRAAVRPVGGIRLVLRALWARIRRLFRRSS